MIMPVIWLLVEYLRGYLVLNGFPWLQTGYSQLETPLAGYIPVAGVYGTGFSGGFNRSRHGNYVSNPETPAVIDGIPCRYMAYRQRLTEGKMDPAYRRCDPGLLDSRQYTAGSKMAAGKQTQYPEIL